MPPRLTPNTQKVKNPYQFGKISTNKFFIVQATLNIGFKLNNPRLKSKNNAKYMSVVFNWIVKPTDVKCGPYLHQQQTKSLIQSIILQDRNSIDQILTPNHRNTLCA